MVHAWDHGGGGGGGEGAGRKQEVAVKPRGGSRSMGFYGTVEIEDDPEWTPHVQVSGWQRDSHTQARHIQIIGMAM
eukprot:25647-Eustigmatos_ZCMA.PRE.1